jgi:mono/diheme cytochrome c family protein
MNTRSIFALLLSLCAAVPMVAQDGAALYRSKCLVCHGANGAGRAALKGTDLLSDAARKASDGDLTESIAHGGKDKNASHSFESKGLTSSDIQALVKYVRVLQAKK